MLYDIKITKNCFVPRENIKLYVAYESNTVKNDVRKKRRENKVFDYTGGKKIRSVIYLKTGEIVIVNTLISTLNQRMQQPEKEAGGSADD